ncbi:hypothetical protein WJX79_007131 [Trebouxia sp. C0005]
MRIAHAHEQSSAQKQAYRDAKLRGHKGKQSQSADEHTTFAGRCKGQSIVALLAACAINSFPVLFDLTDGLTHHSPDAAALAQVSPDLLEDLSAPEQVLHLSNDGSRKSVPTWVTKATAALLDSPCTTSCSIASGTVLSSAVSETDNTADF